MRKISANYIFPISSMPLKNGIIILNDKNKVVKIIDTKGNLKEIENLEFYNGIIAPAFINAHCHLELSFLKNKIKKKKILGNFILNLIKEKNKNIEKNLKLDFIKKADNEMKKNGIIAVGDISNEEISFPVKSKSKIFYHNFIEIYSLDNSKSDLIFEKAIFFLSKISKKFKNLVFSIVPHSPYSVSDNLFEKIKIFSQKNNNIISIHNQETESENELFFSKSGHLYENLKKLNLDLSKFSKKEKTSIEFFFPKISKKNKILLVHNTFTSEKDINFLKKHLEKIFFVLCPSSNLFIENKLPKIDLFYNKNLNVAIGTDSLASNEKLCILEELKKIQNKFPEIPLENLLKWATINGAKSLNLNENFGQIKVGKRAYLNLIENVDLKNMKLKNASKIKVLNF